MAGGEHFCGRLQVWAQQHRKGEEGGGGGDDGPAPAASLQKV
jgi:hypothetical protein